jgi:protein pelota
MKIISQNLKQGSLKIKPESIDDLWCISTILSKGDAVSGITIRKIILGDKTSEKTKAIKKPVFLAIKAEKIDLEDTNLKILGTVIAGPEDIPLGSYHSLNVAENDEIEIRKNWLTYQLDKINEAVNKEDSKIIACIFDREEAIFAKLEKNSFHTISKVAGNVEKKVAGTPKATNFFKEIVDQLTELDNRIKPKHIICASSHFWKNNMENELGDLKKKTIFAIINEVSESSFAELLRRPEIEIALKDQQAVRDARLVEDIFTSISKDSKVAYGLKDCTKANEQSAIETLVCSDNLIKKKRENETMGELEFLFRQIEENGGKIKIISGKGDHVKRLDGLGGIAAKLRFDI